MSPTKILYEKFGSVPQGYILNALMTFYLLMVTLLILRNECKRIFAAKCNEKVINKLTFPTTFDEDIESAQFRDVGDIENAVGSDSILPTPPSSVRLPMTFFCMRKALNTKAKVDA